MQVFKVRQGVKREKYQTGQEVRGERDMGYWDGSDQCWIWHRHRKLAVWACETEGERADTHSWDQANRFLYQIQTRHKLSIILFGWCPQLHFGHYYCSCFWKNKGKWLHSTENINIYTHKDQRIEYGLFPRVSYSTGSWQGRIKKVFSQKKRKNWTISGSMGYMNGWISSGSAWVQTIYRTRRVFSVMEGCNKCRLSISIVLCHVTVTPWLWCCMSHSFCAFFKT